MFTIDLKKKSENVHNCRPSHFHSPENTHCALTRVCALTLYLIQALFDAFANRADPDQTADVCLWKYN